jgi:AraC family transcriptional regulator of adaptative response / DNA-3-methyladenine glycosylase II
MGLVGSRIATIRSVARAVEDGELDFDVGQDVDEFRRRFDAIKGIGEWTAEYVAMRVLKHPDAFPATDLGLLKGAEPGVRLTPGELAQRAESWRPWRAYAASLLWTTSPVSGG